MITAIIHTKNEARNLPPLLRSLRPWVTEIIVADMCSADDTVAIAEQFGARVLHVDDAGFADPARQQALDAAHTPWVLKIDADERIAATLARRLLEVATEDSFDAVEVPFRTYFLGKPLKATGYANEYHTTFFKKTAGTFPGEVHNFFRLAPGSRILRLPHTVENSVIHLNYVDARQVFEKMNRYTTAEAEKICAQGGLTRRRELLAPPYELVRRLFLQKAYQDGWRGVYFSFVMMAYRIATNMKAREISAGAGHQRVSEAYDALSESVADAVESAFARPSIPDPRLAIGA